MTVTRFYNCRIFRGAKFVVDELWVEDGRILDAQKQFFSVKKKADIEVDCKGLRIAPGFIEVQINGGFGIDFTNLLDDFPELSEPSLIANGKVDPAVEKVQEVGRKVLAHGVTSFCPTIITSADETYHNLLDRLPRWPGSKTAGATNLGLHLEGPFINKQKSGAHPVPLIRDSATQQQIQNCYGSLLNVAVVTIAPELPGAISSISFLKSQGIQVSMGHSCGHIVDGVSGIMAGATKITHLFNAMNAFHHRDPCLVGLLAVDQVLKGENVLFYGLIVDNLHTHSSAIRIAYSTHPNGSILVTDAISAMGLPEGNHHLGKVKVTVEGNKATVTGTDTLAGSVATMDLCVRNFAEIAGDCAAILAATLHPALFLGISSQKGTLSIGSDADLVILSDDLTVVATIINGKLVYQNKHFTGPSLELDCLDY